MVVGARGRFTPDRLFDLGNYLFLIVFSVLMIYPFWETAVVSLLPGLLASSWGIKLWPEEVTLEAYRVALSSRLIYYGYVNTVFRTVVGTVHSRCSSRSAPPTRWPSASCRCAITSPFSF